MYLLIKEKGSDRVTIEFPNEDEMIEHLKAMWKYTDGWHIVAIIKC